MTNTVEHETNAEVMQDAEPNLPTVPVMVMSHVLTKELPSRAAGFTTITVDTTGRKLLGHDPQRKLATLTPSAAVVFADRQAGLADGASWPANTPLVLGTENELWAKAATGTADVSIITESWS